jgi:antitoxin (DNA-binding transcriptional repressor) of toxin-antitoxin stability system
MATGIRELKDHLSRYIRRIEAGERISVTGDERNVAAGLQACGAAGLKPGGYESDRRVPESRRGRARRTEARRGRRD